MKKISLIAILITLFVLSIVANVNSSTLRMCFLIVKINKVIEPYKVKDNYYTSCKLNVDIVKAFSAAENVNYDYKMGKLFVGKTRDIEFKGYVTYVDIASLIKKDKYLIVNYEDASWESENDFKSSSSWAIVREASEEHIKAPLLFVYEENELYGYKDENGKVIIPAKFNRVYDFYHKILTQVLDKDKWYLINMKGDIVCEIFKVVVDYSSGASYPDGFTEGFIRYVENGKIGFMDELGNKLIPAKYDFAYQFNKGSALVCNGGKVITKDGYFGMEGGKWGIIDNKGNLLTDMIYKKVNYFKDGVAEVTTDDGKMIKIDKNGKEIKQKDKSKTKKNKPNKKKDKSKTKTKNNKKKA